MNTMTVAWLQIAATHESIGLDNLGMWEVHACRFRDNIQTGCWIASPKWGTPLDTNEGMYSLSVVDFRELESSPHSCNAKTYFKVSSS